MEEGLRKQNEVKKKYVDTIKIPKWLIIFDFLAARLIGVVVVAYWKATWTLADLLLFPDEPYKSIAVSFALGPGITLISMLLQPQTVALTSRMSFVSRQVFFRIYLYVAALSSVNNWRWSWNLLNELTGEGYLSIGASLVIGVLGLMLTRRVVNVVACPGTILLDVRDEDILTWPTHFNTKPGTKAHVGDCLFTAFVTGTFVLGVWRGGWTLFDFFLLPHDKFKSAMASLIISFAFGILLLALREPLRIFTKWLSEKGFLLKLAMEQIHYLLHFVSVVSLWRCLWLLLDSYFLDPPLRYWICHVFGFLGVTWFMASNSLLTRGCAVDGVLPGGDGILLDMRYLRDMILAYQTVKLQYDKKSSPPYKEEELQMSTDVNVKPKEAIYSITTENGDSHPNGGL